MKYSILIPTRNRLEYLKYAIESVLKQNYDNFEIIVSDNNSVIPADKYVKSLNDDRIKYFSSTKLLPVSDNWNSALNYASGEYVIMLGDDDALMPNYFTAANKIFKEHNPDLIYTNSYLYAYPNVLPGYPEGYLYRSSNKLFNLDKPYLLNKSIATKLVSKSFSFNMSFPFNMQHSIIKIDLIQKNKKNGNFFHSPYPDFYATNLIFLVAKNIVIVPQPSVIIGITKKSYGYYHFNNNETAGMNFLNNAPTDEEKKLIEKIYLPGSNNLTSWLIAMIKLQINYGSLSNIKLNSDRYRLLQMMHIYKNYYLDSKLKKNEFLKFKKKLNYFEKYILAPLMTLFCFFFKLFDYSENSKLTLFLRKLFGQIVPINNNFSHGNFRNIMDVYKSML